MVLLGCVAEAVRRMRYGERHLIKNLRSVLWLCREDDDIDDDEMGLGRIFLFWLIARCGVVIQKDGGTVWVQMSLLLTR